jgi:hypothetical protein
MLEENFQRSNESSRWRGVATNVQFAAALIVAEAFLGFGVDGAGELGMMRHNGAKIGQIENEQG